MSVPGRCLSKKSFGGNKRNFLELLMRFVRSDVRDHIASQTTTDLRIDTTLSADITKQERGVRNVPILLQKSVEGFREQ
jgi:hypothetical protein